MGVTVTFASAAIAVAGGQFKVLQSVGPQRHRPSTRGERLRSQSLIGNDGNAVNIFKAMAARSVEEAARTIPVIDFGPAFQGATGGLEAVAAEVRKACEQVGFFYMAGHGVAQAVIDAAFEASREF